MVVYTGNSHFQIFTVKRLNSDLFTQIWIVHTPEHQSAKSDDQVPFSTILVETPEEFPSLLSNQRKARELRHVATSWQKPWAHSILNGYCSPDWMFSPGVKNYANDKRVLNLDLLTIEKRSMIV